MTPDVATAEINGKLFWGRKFAGLFTNFQPVIRARVGRRRRRLEISSPREL